MPKLPGIKVENPGRRPHRDQGQSGHGPQEGPGGPGRGRIRHGPRTRRRRRRDGPRSRAAGCRQRRRSGYDSGDRCGILNRPGPATVVVKNLVFSTWRIIAACRARRRVRTRTSSAPRRDSIALRTAASLDAHSRPPQRMRNAPSGEPMLAKRKLSRSSSAAAILVQQRLTTVAQPGPHSIGQGGRGRDGGWKKAGGPAGGRRLAAAREWLEKHQDRKK